MMNILGGCVWAPSFTRVQTGLPGFRRVCDSALLPVSYRGQRESAELLEPKESRYAAWPAVKSSWFCIPGWEPLFSFFKGDRGSPGPTGPKGEQVSLAGCPNKHFEVKLLIFFCPWWIKMLLVQKRKIVHKHQERLNSFPFYHNLISMKRGFTKQTDGKSAVKASKYLKTGNHRNAASREVNVYKKTWQSWKTCRIQMKCWAKSRKIQCIKAPC